MITTVSLVNICHIVTVFFLVMRTFKIYSLSNFPMCSTALLTIVTMLHITPPVIALLFFHFCWVKLFDIHEDISQLVTFWSFLFLC